MFKSIKFDSNNELTLINLNKNLFENAYVSSENFQETSDIDEFLLDSLNEDVYVLKPINNGEDFIIEYISQNHRKALGIKDLSDVTGCLFSEILPSWKEIFYPTLKETYNSRNENLIKIIVHSSNKIDDFSLVKCKSSNDFVYLIFEEEEIFFKKKIMEYQHNLEWVPNSSNSAISYTDEHNVFYWSEGCYKLLEMKNSDDDRFKDIFFEHIVEEDEDKYLSFLNSIQPNKSEGFIVYRIKTDTGKLRYIGEYTKAIFDKNYHEVSRVSIRHDISDRDSQFSNVDILDLLSQIESKTNFAFIIWTENEGYLVTNEFYKLLGFKENESKIPITHELFINNIVGSDFDYMGEFNKLDSGLADELDLTFKYKAADGSIKTLNLYIKTAFNNQKVGVLFDRTEQLLEKQKLCNAYHEKDVLLNELRHRVKNNLQILKSFISLEERFNEKDYHDMLEVTKSRIDSMALIHQRSYATENFTKLNVKEYIEDITQSLLDLFESSVIIDINVQEDLYLDVERITSLNLIINELTINSLKYAFPDDKANKCICISLIVEEGMCKFKYRDNGIGYPKDFSEGLGMKIVNALTTQLRGSLKYIGRKGVYVKIDFPMI